MSCMQGTQCGSTTLLSRLHGELCSLAAYCCVELVGCFGYVGARSYDQGYLGCG